MLILILTDVQCSQKDVFSFEKGLNYQNPGKKSPQGKFSVPYPLQLFGKPWRCYGIMCTAFDIAILYILNKYMMKMTLMMMMTQLPINSGYQSIGQP